MSDVSIVIPCRNGADYLAQTIRSALGQTAPPREIVVVDDGSTDDSAAIAAGLGPRVRVVAGAEAGAAAARTLGAEHATGARLMFLDADDLLTPGTLAALGATLDPGPEAAFAICRWDRYELEQGGWIARPPTARLRRPGRDALAAWLEGSWSPPCTILWTREGYARSGGWGTRWSVEDDGALVRRALARGVAAVPSAGGLALYRRLPEGRVSLSGQRMSERGLQSRLDGIVETRDAVAAAGAVGRYRRPLAAAFREIAADAPPGSAIARAADDAARSLRPLPAVPGPAAEVAARLAARVGEWRRLAAEAPAPASVPDPVPPITEGPLVSVVVPTYQRREAVGLAAASVLGQTYRDLELIVVDDGSTDGTAEALEALGDPRLRVLRQPNGGVALARNRGLAAARGAYIAFLDSDDTWLPEKLAHQIAALEAAPRRYGFCHTGVEIRRDGTCQETRPAQAAGDAFAALLLANGVHAPTSSGVFRREVYEAVGGFDPHFPAIEDWEWLVRVARLYHFLPVDLPLCRYADTDDPNARRRSQAFRANMEARELFWRRNAHAMRRAGCAHLFLMESARRELREAEGAPRAGRALVLRALAERPQHRPHWTWLPYMAAPFALRRWLRRLDAPAHARRQDEIGAN